MTKAEAMAFTPPPAALARCKRILDGAARRLLADQIEAQAIGTARPDSHGPQQRDNHRSALVAGQLVPVVGAHPQPDREAA